jgi:glutamyl-tRNA synthetase
VGTAFIALFNYCFAKQHGGEFLLRIEDTDQVRSTRSSEQVILDALTWCGLTWDEGPDVGGPHGPYRQSERSALYTTHSDELLKKGHAFRCFCTSERLLASRKEREARGDSFVGYDGTCTELAGDDITQKLADGVPYVVRMKVPRGEQIVIQDRLRGAITFQTDEIDMQVLMKSDGLPTYHLANVVDDHHMEITHVIRGEEWISSAPKHKLLYDYFGWEMPELTHMPLLRNPDKSKLSKRKNPTSILYYERMGLLPEALLNYLGMMGWSMPSVEGEEAPEVFSLEEMVAHFDLDRVSVGGPVFDTIKLEHINGRWLRERMDDDEYAERVVSWALNAEYMKPMIPMIKQRVNRFTELPQWLAFFFAGPPEHLTVEQLLNKQITDEQELVRVLQFTLWHLEALSEWDMDHISGALREVSKMCEVKFGSIMKVVFPVVCGSASGPPMFDALELLGADMSRARFRSALLMACGGQPMGSKKISKMQKAYRKAQAALLESEEA